MSDTRKRILDTARALFNEEGLHRVGVRDIARAVGLSPGNLAYHFRTKDDLVSALVLELHELSARTVFGDPPADFSFLHLYRSAVTAMQNVLGYRFVLLSYVDAVMASPELQRLEHSLWTNRRRRLEAMMDRLADNGFLDRRAFAARADLVYEQGDMISSSWLTHEALRPERRSDDVVVLHYAKVGCALLEPYCTPKGLRQMRRILAGAHDSDVRTLGAVTPSAESRGSRSPSRRRRSVG